VPRFFSLVSTTRLLGPNGMGTVNNRLENYAAEGRLQHDKLDNYERVAPKDAIA
jgi:hypothetical protein